MFTLSAMLITKSRVASIRLTPAELRAIRGAARRAKKRPSDWMRETLTIASKKK